MKKFNFSIVVILTMIFASNVSAQLVNRTAAIDRLQGEVVEIAADPSYGLSNSTATTTTVESVVPFNKMLVTHRLAYHKTVLENLLLDTQLTTAGALSKTQDQFATLHELAPAVIVELNADVVDLLN